MIKSKEFLFSINSSRDSIETVFKGKDFCQWLVSNNHMENEFKAENYFQELVNNKQIICIDRLDNSESMNHWYAFSK
jgi:hypothetical protein